MNHHPGNRLALLFSPLLVGLLVGGLAFRAAASHFVGGELTMHAVGDKPGHFKVQLLYYFNEDAGIFRPTAEYLSYYRKRDHAFLGGLRAAFTKRMLLPYLNPACAKLRRLNLSEARYEGDLQLKPEDFADPQGYYLAYQGCCRIGSITNTRFGGYVLYLEFPPLLKAGTVFSNSSPVFHPVSGEYVCLREPFATSFAALDPDGDRLRYSLVTPLENLVAPNGQVKTGPGPYPEIRWTAGFSADNAIPGSPPLRIDPTTGTLSVTATIRGLFVFAVRVEEFRDGQKIGEVRRDFQLLVTDCALVPTPDAPLLVQNQPVGTVPQCIGEGKTITLSTAQHANLSYQWRRNGAVIPGATGPSLPVVLPGEYQLFTSLTDACSRVQPSRPVTITRSSAAVALRLPPRPLLCGQLDTLRLDAPTGSGYRYRWLAEPGNVVQTSDRAFFAVTRPGRYYCMIDDPVMGCTYRSDTVRIDSVAPPRLRLPPELSTWVGGTVRLRPEVRGGPVRVAWSPTDYLTDPTRAETSAVGIEHPITYRIEAQDTLGCRGVASVYVRVYVRIWVPTVFTPNGDGINDEWTLKGIAAYPQAEVRVFTRWGEEVFRDQNGYPRPFTGTRQGVPLPSGDYVYLIRPAPDQPLIKGLVAIAR